MADIKSFSPRYPNLELTDKDTIIKIEKVIGFLVFRRGTHFNLKQYGSPLYDYIDKYISKTTISQLNADISSSLSLFLPKIVQDVKIDIRAKDDNGFTLFLTVDNNIVEIDSTDSIFNQ